MKRSWFTITNKSATEAEICIYDEIGLFGITAKDFLTELKGVGDRKIVLRINSPGGEVFDGLAIFNRLREHGPCVEVRIDGIAASMASVIAMAGAPVKMAANALIMMHNPNGLCVGDSGDMRDLADMLDKVRGSLTRAYENKTGKTSDEISAMMDAETWLNADEALAMGFADEITGALKMAAKFDRLKFDGKLEAREKTLDTILKNETTTLMPENLDKNAKTPEQIEAERILAEKAEADNTAAVKAAADLKAVTDKANYDKGVADEHKRVTDITAWAKEVSELRKVDLSAFVAEFTADQTKSFTDFKEHVLKNEFKAKPLITNTDTTSAAGASMTRAEFNKLSPFNRAEFCKKGGKITEPKLRLYQEVEA